MTIVNIAGYKFVPLDKLPEWQSKLQLVCQSLSIKGTILLAPEGINVNLAGARIEVDHFLNDFRQFSLFSDIVFKESFSQQQPFDRMLIKLRNEIITSGLPEVQPSTSDRRLSPQELKCWLDEGRDIVLLDTRNDFEYQAGTFEQAIQLNIERFRDFGTAIRQLDNALKEKPVVVFCTGGIRCEKAAPIMSHEGFQEVYQLDGGILKYFEVCGGAHYIGDCFVFDQRVALDHNLQPENDA